MEILIQLEAEIDSETMWEHIRPEQFPVYFSEIWPEVNFEIGRSFASGHKISELLTKYNELNKRDINRISKAINNLNVELLTNQRTPFSCDNLLYFTGHAIYGYDRLLKLYNNHGEEIYNEPLITSKDLSKEKIEKINNLISQLQNQLSSLSINPRFDTLALLLMAKPEYQCEVLPNLAYGSASGVIHIHGLLEGLRIYCDDHLLDESTPHQNRVEDSKNSNRSRFFCHKLNVRMRYPLNIENNKRELIRQLCISLVWKGDPRELDTQRLSEWLGPLSQDLTQ